MVLTLRALRNRFASLIFAPYLAGRPRVGLSRRLGAFSRATQLDLARVIR